jgi:hypothetical protein
VADDEPSLVCDILSIHEPKLESLEPPGLPFSACRQLASALLTQLAAGVTQAQSFAPVGGKSADLSPTGDDSD